MKQLTKLGSTIIVQRQQQPLKKKKTAPTKKKFGLTPALPREPNVKPDAVNVVGIIPRDVHVDPELTEGHAAYEESGDSELTQHL